MFNVTCSHKEQQLFNRHRASPEMYAHHFMVRTATRHCHACANYYIHQIKLSSSLYLRALMENEKRIYINFEWGGKEAF